MKTKTWWIAALVIVILFCLAGVYFIIFPPGSSSALLKAELEQTREKVKILTQENDLKLDRINSLSQELRAVRAKYEAERRGRIEAVEKKYLSIDPDGTVGALNAITDRARKRRLETVQSRGDPD